MESVFWKDGFEDGKAHGGLFLRNNLGKEIARLEEASDHKINIVGIKIDTESWTLEFAVED